MPTLIYKRTHSGDPDPHAGTFGNHDCMGRVRSWPFSAVIGVGGTGAEPVSSNIARKLTWVGIGARLGEPAGPDHRGPTVMFDRFLYLGEDGPLLADLAPNLAAHMYGHNVRAVMRSLSAQELAEVSRILELAEHAPASRALGRPGANTRPSNFPLQRSGARCARPGR
ncbi:MAG: hypothetical protein HYY95_10940 [Candidatus Rokubacteria bacterium]|nr:hypothetical protein [Candidatus Rokubacteria bacterium]